MLTCDDDPRVVHDSWREMLRAVKCKGQKRFGAFLDVHSGAFTTWHRHCTAAYAGGTYASSTSEIDRNRSWLRRVYPRVRRFHDVADDGVFDHCGGRGAGGR